MTGLPTILFVVSASLSSRGSIIFAPSCEEDVWAWLHHLRTRASLDTVEQTRDAAKFEREKCRKERGQNGAGMGGSRRSPSPLAGLRPATGAAHPQKTKNRRPEK
jgi:hypothetical protein